MNALLVGIDSHLAEALRATLRLRWHEAEVIPVAEGDEPDGELAAADIAFVNSDSLAIVKSLRALSSVGIVVITREDRDEEMMEALDAGADDYLEFPFTPARLLGRVGALLRRLRRIAGPHDSHRLKCGPLDISVGTHEVQLAGKDLRLTPMEFNLLCHLARSRGDALTTGALHKLLWECDEPLYVDTLRKYVQRLRKKLNGGGPTGMDLVTIRGVGYRLAYRPEGSRLGRELARRRAVGDTGRRSRRFQ